MSKLRVASFSVSIDGFGAGLAQDLENPMGRDGLELHQWAFTTRTIQKMFGNGGGATGVDDDFVARGFDNIGAWILGRNMFGPIRGPWHDESWKGWWGDEPPYRVPVYVLTHHARPSISMRGGTVFHFVTEGPQKALELAIAAAGGKDVRVGGGVATIRQYLQERAIDEMHLAVSPVILGAGESLFAGIDLRTLGYRPVEHAATSHASHVVLAKHS